MAAPREFVSDDAFTACVKQCRDDLDDRARDACTEAWFEQPEGEIERERHRGRAMGTTFLRDRRMKRAPAADDASIAKAIAIIASIQKKEKAAVPESVHSEPESVHSEGPKCHMDFEAMKELFDVRMKTPGGSPSLSSAISLSSVKIIGGPGARAASTSSSCDRTERVLEQCWIEFERGSSGSLSSVTTSSGSSSLSSSSGSSLYGKAMREDYGNYYAANMQSMNGLHLYDLNEINECRMNLEQCEQSQHSLFLLDGVLLLTLVSLSFIGVLCIVCLCVVIIARYIPFNQRKSGHVTYQNADTEIGNL